MTDKTLGRDVIEEIEADLDNLDRLKRYVRFTIKDVLIMYKADDNSYIAALDIMSLYKTLSERGFEPFEFVKQLAKEDGVDVQ